MAFSSQRFLERTLLFDGHPLLRSLAHVASMHLNGGLLRRRNTQEGIPSVKVICQLIDPSYDLRSIVRDIISVASDFYLKRTNGSFDQGGWCRVQTSDARQLKEISGREWCATRDKETIRKDQGRGSERRSDLPPGRPHQPHQLLDLNDKKERSTP
ncbi:hypothetical protein TNCV_3721371 [Trichonephila clavipes]|nr:hypothetical protein TNCV_3721371 [Trichonephila clavipes]